MGGGWTLMGDLVKLSDETDTVRIGPDSAPPSPLPKLEVAGDALVLGKALVTLQDRGGNVFDVKAYGAKGDGTTPDDGAIIDAIEALRAGGGGTLYFPPGQYLLDEEILINGWIPPNPPDPGKPINYLVRGAGPGATGC